MIIDIEPFETKFEDVSIYVHKMKTNLFYEVVGDSADRLSGYTGVWTFHNVTHEFQQGKSIIGDIQVLFRNQGENFNLCLFLITTVSASSPIDKSGRSVFCKLIQYLFDWTNEYVKNKDIKDNTGKPFIMPSFGYSKDMFTGIED